MKVSIDGLLLRAAAQLKLQGDDSAYGFMLEELCNNLIELRDRTQAGDMAAVKEFFDVYVTSKKE